MRPKTLAGEALPILLTISCLFLVNSAASATLSALSIRTSLPKPWSHRDVGAPAIAGGARVDEGALIVMGAGRGIGGSRDQFHYVFQPVEGRVEIVTRLSSLGKGSTIKTGVMIRADLTASAPHASILGSSQGWIFQRRLSAGATADSTSAPRRGVPGWMKLVREGKLFSAYHSADGSAWTLIDSDTIAMPSTVYVGLAMTSSDDNAAAAAAFANTLVRGPVDTNDPPSVSLTSPSSTDLFRAPASIAIKASAADSDGTVSRVDFYRGSTLIGSDAASPYGMTWGSVAAGTYSITAVAIDNDGARSISLPLTIVVTTSSGTPRPTTLAFKASADHATLVKSYTVAIYRAVDPLSATPVARLNIGKPAPVGGEIASDITSLIDALPRADYKAVVFANGSAGSTASAPSASFAR